MTKTFKKYMCFVLALLVSSMLLCGCGNAYSDEDIEQAKDDAYRDGFDDGYYYGSQEQQEQVLEEYLIDGCSIRDIEDRVRDEFGMTPSEAFSVIDEYEYDWTHGGYTWEEYQHAIEAVYYTAQIFPEDY